MPDRWPNLLYVSDTPAANTYAGASLMYRLLSAYPAERLRIYESSLGPSTSGDRIPGVSYTAYNGGTFRPLMTRFRPLYADWLFLTARRRARRIVGATRGWTEAVMTVAHHYAWITAAEVALMLKVPLHLIVHDEPSDTMRLSPRLRRAGERAVADAYRQAASRLCVSPAMVELYEKRYGVPGQVLYPARGPNSVSFDSPPRRLTEIDRPLVFAYGGSVASDSYGNALASLSDVLGPTGHKLHVYSNLTPGAVTRYRLDRPWTRVGPMLKSEAYLRQLRDTADALFVPMSFAPADRVNSEIAFPSKLTEYTAAGLPLLLWGPSYCSAVRWAGESPGCAVVVTDPSTDALAEGVGRIADHPQDRASLAQSALETGGRYFSATAAAELLHKVVSRQ